MFRIYLLFLLIFGACCLNHANEQVESNADKYEVETDDLKNVPYYVQILNFYSNRHFCGGAMISEQWIITSSRCITRESRSDYRVVSGTTNLPDRDDSDQHIHEIEDVFIPEGKSYKNDVALAKLKQPIKISETEKPVKIRSRPLEKKEYLKVSGLGFQQIWDLPYMRSTYWLDFGSSSIPVPGPLDDYRSCKERFERVDRDNTYKNGLKTLDDVFCSTLFRNGKTLLELGAPAVDKNGELTGISLKSHYFWDRFPDAFTNLMMHRDWIKNVTKIEEL